MNALLLFFLLQIQQSPTCVGNLNTPGCKSFREMMNRKDSDIIEKITSPSVAYVCFTPKTDEFTVISFNPPSEMEFSEDEKNKYLSTAPGLAEIATYLDGVENYSTVLFGTWIAYGKKFKNATFDTHPEKDPKYQSSEPVDALEISSSEVDASFSYKNSSNERVTISIKVRRSTLRFQKMFQFPVNGKNMNTTDTGYCAEFK